MVNISKISKKYGARTLFENVNISLIAGNRYGLIGANGAGKSTFLNILSGKDDATTGEIKINSNIKVGSLGQNQFAFESFTLFDAVLYGNKKLYDAVKEKEDLYVNGDMESEKVMNRLSDLEMVCVDEDPNYECEVKIGKILESLGFSKNSHSSLMSSVANSNKFKILLAQVLFLKPDVLYLDEPTNNLDMTTISWLEKELSSHDGVLVVISHDRHFINAVVNKILDVDFQNISEFTGNYDDWYIASTLVQKQKELARDKQTKEKEKLEDFVRRFSANASKAKQATSRQKKLDNLDIQVIKVSARRDPKIVFRQNRIAGREILSVKNLSKSFDALVLNDISFEVQKGDKIAIIGANGIGKTTLCSLIIDSMKPDSGEINFGSTITTSYFPQNTTDLINGNETLYDWLQAFDKKADLSVIRNALGRMLFSGEEQQKSIKSISGGEKHRMMLSKMMLEESNFLIMDEPTNHLDLEAIIALGEALHEYEGNVICVCHDRELIDAFANRIFQIQEDGSLLDFRGGYEDFNNR